MTQIRQVLIATAVCAGLEAATAAAGPAEASGAVPEARQPVQELFLSEVVFPQSTGEWQLTAASRLGRRGAGLALTAEYGLSDWWQVSAEWDGGVVGAADGEGAERSIEVASQLSLIGIGGSPFHLALGIALERPYGSPQARLGVEPYLIVARDFGNRRQAQLFGQLTLAREEEGDHVSGDRDDAATGLVLHLGGMLALGSAAATLEVVDGGPRERLLSPGLVLHPARGWEVGMGFVLSLAGGGERNGIVLAATHEF